jgi:L-iditol 2-dehydrogenase
MLAARLIGPFELSLNEEPTPGIEADEVLLRIEAVGVCGSDLHRYRGVRFPDENPGKPMILGHEFSATVSKCGLLVRNVTEGDRVAVEAGNHCGHCEWCRAGQFNLCPNVKFCAAVQTDGALREFMAWPARLLYKLPPKLTFDDGVLIEVIGIAMHSIHLAHMRPGQTAAVLGSGPVGLATIHLLRKTAGCSFIFATDILPYRLEAGKKVGADVVLNPKQTDVVEQVMEMTQGRGVDVVFEAAGEGQTSKQAVEICTHGGKIILIGIPEDDQTPFSTAAARRNGLTFRFVRRSANTYSRSIALLENSIIDLKGLVTHHFSLPDVNKAFRIANDYQDNAIKVVVNP